MVGSDLFYFRRVDFLAVVDYFSNYLLVRKIANSTSSAVIKELRMIFSEFGKPQVFRSDNGPCYVSQEFRFFMQNWSIKHRTSSPHYPQSNGLAESMVKVSKNLIEKAVLQDLAWNCHAIKLSIKQGMVIVNTWVFILRRYKWHIHAGSWSLVNCWREGSTLPYKGCS